jgi:DNA-directed RNA polymerase specialized sigma24 family protein
MEKNRDIIEERILTYFDYCFSYALFLSKNKEDAKEITQEVAAKTLRANPNGRLLGEKYFRQAVYGVFLNRIRNKHVTQYEVPDYASNECAETRAANLDMIERVRKVVSAEEFLFLQMSAEGYSLGEIAKTQGQTKSYVSVRVERARVKALKTV